MAAGHGIYRRNFTAVPTRFDSCGQGNGSTRLRGENRPRRPHISLYCRRQNQISGAYLPTPREKILEGTRTEQFHAIDVWQVHALLHQRQIVKITTT